MGNLCELAGQRGSIPFSVEQFKKMPGVVERAVKSLYFAGGDTAYLSHRHSYQRIGHLQTPYADIIDRRSLQFGIYNSLNGTRFALSELTREESGDPSGKREMRHIDIAWIDERDNTTGLLRYDLQSHQLAFNVMGPIEKVNRDSWYYETVVAQYGINAGVVPNEGKMRQLEESFRESEIDILATNLSKIPVREAYGIAPVDPEKESKDIAYLLTKSVLSIFDGTVDEIRRRMKIVTDYSVPHRFLR